MYKGKDKSGDSVKFVPCFWLLCVYITIFIGKFYIFAAKSCSCLWMLIFGFAI